MDDGARRARELLLAFAERTGLTGSAPQRRYLWTDAFATCTLLGLHRRTGERALLDLALKLVGDVHRVLGRHRNDDARSGWISGLPEAEGALHPTRGGLRIGKPLPERGPGEPVDERLEWDRDGQYFHYLTRWMHALRSVARETGEPRYLQWAVELAGTAQAAFAVAPRRMAWKMSIDLRRPLVASMGQHDPLDALVTDLELAAGSEPGTLAREIAEAAATCEGMSWATSDPLGAGGLLDAAARLATLRDDVAADRRALLDQVIEDARTSLRAIERSGFLAEPPEERLAFRELGLSIGLHAVDRAGLPAFTRFQPLAPLIEAQWSAPSAQRAATWTDHLDINAVMLATSLAPAGWVE